MTEKKNHTLIIGGTKGIGRTIAKTLAERGHQISVLGISKPLHKIEKVDDWQADLEYLEDYIQIINGIIEKNGPITNLVFSQRYRGEDSLDKEMTVDVVATKNIIDYLTSNGSTGGNLKTITIISSIAGQYVAEEQNVHYHMAKAALNQLVKYYATILGPQGICVNGISPGTTIKDESKDFYAQNSQLCDLYKNIIPLRRMGTAEDVARTVAFMCSDDASFITGQNIIIDGGISLQGHEALARRLTSFKNKIVTPSNLVTPQISPPSNRNQITPDLKCRLCQSPTSHFIMRLASTPIGDAYLYEKKELPCYPLDLHLCTACGLLQIPHLIDSAQIYRDYIYHTADSLGLVEHFRKYVETVLERIKPPSNSLVVEIGSNDGSALQCYKKAGRRVLGVDPAREIAEQATQKGITTLPEFFNAALAQSIATEHGKASIIMANNVLANIDDLTEIMNGIKTLLAPDGVFVFETGYALDLIQKKIFDNIYHEHLSYFSVRPLQQFFHRHGLQLIQVERVPTKGGSIRCTVQLVGGRRREHSSVRELLELEEVTEIHKLSRLQTFSAQIEQIKKEMTALLKKLKSQGKKIAGYGAIVGCTTVLYALELWPYIDFLVDDNTNRQNRYAPGLQIPVKSPNTIYDADYTVILAWQYAEPITKKHKQYLEQGGKFLLFLPTLSITGK